ncbi:MAG: XcyI family restriction endonuclease [Microbacteriaceae bacterium]|nr:XcyI family restriction endonuclease [Microbacteriaceae bacterium]
MSKAPRKSVRFPTLDPRLQVSFFYKLQAARRTALREALQEAVSRVEVPALDAELARRVSSKAMSRVASFGLRGELFFPLLLLLRARPALLGYYRLLLGFSQKEFYNKGPFGRFKSAEDRGEWTPGAGRHIEALCVSLVRSAEILVDRIDPLSTQIIHELQLLTLGPQLRGSENTRIGAGATRDTFALISKIAGASVVEATEKTLLLRNASRRSVLIEFAADPDIQITEMLSAAPRPIVSIEIKGGADASNIHNRLGEAEKSHQKAKSRGFMQFWTCLKVEIDPIAARKASPTTTHFFHLDRIRKTGSREHRAFRELFAAVVGIKSQKRLDL